MEEVNDNITDGESATERGINDSFEEENKDNTAKQSGFGIRKRLRSGYNKRFASIMSGNSKAPQQEGVSLDNSTHNFGKIGKIVSNHFPERHNATDTLPEMNVENASNTSLYILRRNNSRQNSRSNSLVNSLYLNNLNHSGTANNGLYVNTSGNSGYNTPKMGPETPAMVTPNLGYNHKYQNSVSSFSSMDYDNNNSNAGLCTPTPTTSNLSNFFPAPIDLTNEFINILKQEYENYCLNPKATPFDQNNPPPGVIEIIFKKSKWHVKVQKLYICKNNKNQISLDSNDSLYNILKHILMDNNYSARRNISRANSVSSFQLDMNYPLRYNSNTLENNLNLEIQQPTPFNETNASFTSYLDKVNDIIMDVGNDQEVKKTDDKTDYSNTNTLNSGNPSNPILFSPRKLKREESVGAHKIDSFDSLLEKKVSELSSIGSLEEINDTNRETEPSTEQQFVLEQAPNIEKKK